MLETNSKRPVVIWLLSGCFLIFAMVIIGGITRLTHSGLSMVEWNMVMGSLPPMSHDEWSEVFEKYKQFPEYQQVNKHFTLNEFKSIFWWEYIHRFLGRLIGLLFVVPFLIFWIKRKLSTSLIKRLFILLFLGGLQGFFGWYMVKSGLTKNPDVSHYRLALHLITAFLTFGYTFWVVLDLLYEKPIAESKVFNVIKRYLNLFFLLIVVQVIYGAFVAGLNAGFIYNTFPKMGGDWIADSVVHLDPFYLNFIEGIAGVQFVHRYIPILLVLLAAIIWYQTRRSPISSSQKLATNFLIVGLGVQFLLGVFTLVYAVPISLGVLHQAGAFFLFAASIFALHRFSGYSHSKV